MDFVHNLQRELVLVEASRPFTADSVLLTRCVKKAGKSFHIATSASSFSGLKGFPALLTASFELKLDVTCFKAGLSLVVWIFSVAYGCRALTAHVQKISNMLGLRNCCCMRWKLRCSPPHTLQSKKRFDAILIACIENCILSQRSAAGFTRVFGVNFVNLNKLKSIEPGLVLTRVETGLVCVVYTGLQQFGISKLDCCCLYIDIALTF